MVNIMIRYINYDLRFNSTSANSSFVITVSEEDSKYPTAELLHIFVKKKTLVIGDLIWTLWVDYFI